MADHVNVSDGGVLDVIDVDEGVDEAVDVDVEESEVIGVGGLESCTAEVRDDDIVWVTGVIVELVIDV